MIRRIIACLFVLGLSVSPIWSEDGTFWIGPDREEVHSDAVRFNSLERRHLTLHKVFRITGKVRQARLRLGADFCTAEVKLNDNVVLSATPYDLPVPISVTRWCDSGENALLVAIKHPDVLAAVAIELELELDNGAKQVIRSDESWTFTEEGRASQLRVFGRVDVEPWWGLKTRPAVSAFDEYNQWQEAKIEVGAGAAKLQLPENFAMEVVYRATEEDGSWISLTIDDMGRLLVGKEKAGVVRLTLGQDSKPQIELMNAELKGCHGILWSAGSLFINASDSKALYRLRDTNGDDTFNEVRLLREVPGGRGDHGRNDLTIGPDGSIYSIHGDAVDLPDGFTSRIPVTHEFKAGRPKGGHLIRTNAEGSVWQVVASGLRNPYGIAFNRDGEPFTYDADSESHVGLPWYRPTRMNHLVPGTDYGWRSREALPWPIYYADILPPNVLIGRGSPTSLRFAYPSQFPPAYREALFAPDWSFGRVFAVHVVPRGASYSMHPETFLRGRPLNVCDLEFAPDGSMYLLTGGYGTRSVLYRLRYTGPPPESVPQTVQSKAREAYSQILRVHRRVLESYQRHDAEAVSFCWQSLGHPDKWIRHAARLVLEHQPAETWQDRLWIEKEASLSLPALLALVRTSNNPDMQKTAEHLQSISLEELPPHLLSTSVRIVQWLDEYHSRELAEDLVKQFESVFPTWRPEIDRELCSLLSMHGSEQVVTKTLDLLAGDPPQQDALHYLIVLSKTKQGWSVENREEFFRLMASARLFQGDEGLPEIVGRIQEEALSLMPAEQQEKFKTILKQAVTEGVDPTFAPRSLIKKWSLKDFGQLALMDGDRTVGSQVFQEAQCAKCHRLGRIGRSWGPDLTGLAGRYRRNEILESILHPSNNVPSRFVNHVIVTNDGKLHTGQVVWNGFRKSIVRIAENPMQMDVVTEISKHDIESQSISSVSPMPAGLLDSFSMQEIESLLMYIETGGRN